MRGRITLFVAGIWVLPLIVVSLMPDDVHHAIRAAGLHRLDHFAGFGMTAPGFAWR